MSYCKRKFRSWKIWFSKLICRSASKFGVIGFTESIAKEVSNYNVKVMAICPGRVDTTKMIDDIVDNGYNPSNKNLMKPEQIAKKIYGIHNQKDYYNGQSVEFYNK